MKKTKAMNLPLSNLNPSSDTTFDSSRPWSTCRRRGEQSLPILLIERRRGFRGRVVVAEEIMVSTLLQLQGGTALVAANKYTLAQSHEARLEAVRTALDYACNELEINKHLKQDLSEDQLTIEICQFLSALGFQPRHDEQVGGIVTS